MGSRQIGPWRQPCQIGWCVGSERLPWFTRAFAWAARESDTMITEIEDYFTLGCGRCERFATPDCSTRRWQDGLNDLRAVCLDLGLVETVKWGHPCYMHAGRNIAVFGAFRGDFRLSFMNAALMKDPEGVLRKPGPNTQHANMISFSANEQVREMEPILRDSIVREAHGCRTLEAGESCLPRQAVTIELARGAGRGPGRGP